MLRIHCTTCGRETAAVRRFGPLGHRARPGGPLRWLNICVVCHMRYVTIAPRAVHRMRLRYERASRQLSLLGTTG